ncbi:hypothetical protein BOX15_Mlig030558g1, partial [Macrostomum lignano]
NMSSLESTSDKPAAKNRENDESSKMLPLPTVEASGTSSAAPAATSSSRDFALFDTNFDLNSQPANYFRQRSSLEKLVFQASRESTEKLDPQYSIRLASKFPKLVGNVDVISASRNVKSLLKMPYSPGNHVSLMVHRVGDSLLLDEFDLFAFMLRQDFENWHWLRHFAASNNMAVRPTGYKRDDVSNKRLMTKFLYHTASVSDEASGQSRTLQQQQQQQQQQQVPASSAASSADAGLEDPLKCMVWNFENVRMLLGTNLPIFGGPKHPCISVRLRDSSKPINVLTGIDYWLDNMINGVPELAMCYHSNGLFKGFDIFSTDNFPRVAGFDPDSVREIARSLVWFLKANATKEGHTYWLFKAPNSDIVKLYDLTSLCENPAQYTGGSAADTGRTSSPAGDSRPSSQDSSDRGGCPTGTAAGSGQDPEDNPFATPVGMLCYRVARSCFEDADSRSQLSLRERSRLRRLLACSLQLLNQSSQHRAVLASCNLLLSELLLFDGQQERLELQHQRRQQRQNQQQQQKQQRMRRQPHRRPHRQALLAVTDSSVTMDLRQLMQSLQSDQPPTHNEETEAPSAVEPDNDEADEDDEDAESGGSGSSDSVYSTPLARARASLSHAVAAARLLLLAPAGTADGQSSQVMSDLDAIPMAKSGVAIPLPLPSTTTAAVSSAVSVTAGGSLGELATALCVVAKSCLQVADHLTGEVSDRDSSDKTEEQKECEEALSAILNRNQLLLTCLRVAAASVGIALVQQQSVQASARQELASLELLIAERSADAMMQVYRSQDSSSSHNSEPHQQQQQHSTAAVASSSAAGSLAEVLNEADKLLNERLLMYLTDSASNSIAIRAHSTLTSWLAIQGAASADCLSQLVSLYRLLCDRCKLQKRLLQLRDRLASAVNEWCLRILVEVKHGMAQAEADNATGDDEVWKKMEKRLESALDAVKQVQQQPSSRATKDAVYLLATKALLLRALNECRHSRPRRLHSRQQQQQQQAPPTVSWAEIQLHDAAMQTYQAALDRLGPRNQLDDSSQSDPSGSASALWDNLAWQRLMALVDKIEALTTATVEGFSEAERCKEVIRLSRQALTMCDTETPGDRRDSFRYQAAQAHKNVADMLLRAYLEGWSTAKSLSDCRSKWMSGYTSCISLLLSIRADKQLRNPHMCLEAIGKLAKFQMDRADEHRKRATATGAILGPNQRRYRHELALLRILAVARHPLEELLADNADLDWSVVRSLIRVVSREALDAVRGLLQLARILRDSEKLDQVKNLYAALLRRLNSVVSDSETGSTREIF